MLLGICAGGGNPRAVISAGTLFAAHVGLGLMAAVVPGSAGPKSTGSDREPALRLAQRAEPRISIASAIAAAPASQVLLTIDVGPRESLPITGFIRVRGLPPFVSIGDGQAIAPGTWAIPLYALPVLRLNIPAGISGRTEFEVALVSIDGRVLAEARTSLILAPPSGLDAGKAAAPVPSPATLPISPGGKTNPGLTPADPSPGNKSAEEFLAQGERYLAQGMVGGARLFFRQAADAGLAQAAMRLAATYDPVELSILKVQGIAPDPLEARKWYERARELGAAEAQARLARLSGN